LCYKRRSVYHARMGIGHHAGIEKLLREIRRHYRAHGRSHLPWRATTEPYRILVSEIMLQQTQVERVVPFYAKFLKIFPTARVLSKAKLSRVLSVWQGLGYNRRAKYLHEAAKAIARRGSFPRRAEDIEALPGVGHYTARAVAAFAFDSPEVFIETNIRTAFLHRFHKGPSFMGERTVLDSELLPLVAEALERSKMPPREFYAALMDYGSYLKRSGVKLNQKSAHYAKQSHFVGSARQLRGAILRELLKKPSTIKELSISIARAMKMKRSQTQKTQISRELMRLVKEKLITKKGIRFYISE